MNVLSIDFDIIMHPDIMLYNSIVSPDRPFEGAKDRHPLIQFARADLTRYQTLLSFILEVAKHLDVENIRVGVNHDDIKYLLEGQQDVHVFNVDHHHDLGYPDNNPDVCSCANWGDFYLRKGTITHFTWIKNENSDDENSYEDNDSRLTFLNYPEYNLYNLPQIDKLFLCLSPDWVPPMYHPLFFTILDLINQQKGCHLEVH